jgi:hypothetical protein
MDLTDVSSLPEDPSRTVKLERNKNKVPTGASSRNETPRQVYIGCSPMEINEKIMGDLVDITGKIIAATGRIPPPNPTFHWAVLVGDYVHELSYDTNYFNYYENKSVKEGEFRLYPVGVTRFNDQATNEEGMSSRPLLI